MATTVTSEELELAIQALFEKSDNLSTAVEAATTTANTALETATATAKALANIHTVPSNSYDLAISAVHDICWTVGLIGFIAVGCYGIYKLCTFDEEPKKKERKHEN